MYCDRSHNHFFFLDSLTFEGVSTFIVVFFFTSISVRQRRCACRRKRVEAESLISAFGEPALGGPEVGTFLDSSQNPSSPTPSSATNKTGTENGVWTCGAVSASQLVPRDPYPRAYQLRVRPILFILTGVHL